MDRQKRGSILSPTLRQWWGKPARVSLILLLCTSGVCVAAPARTASPLVALASSFRGPWPELMLAYRSETGLAEPRTSFAASGLLTTQIRHGAPFELYLAADQMSVQQLRDSEKTRGPSVTLARGSLSLVCQRFSKPLESTEKDTSETECMATTGLQALAEKLQKAEPFKLAIPNPRHAPYGIAARQALENTGIWPLPPGYLLNAENAAQTLQFALSGAVEYAIVPDTLILHLPDTLQQIPLAPGSYDPVIHQMVLLNTAGPDAETLFEWLQGKEAAIILSRFGLTPEH